MGSRVLVIDDEVAAHHAIRRCIESLGVQVQSAMSFAEGLEFLSKSDVDTVILDLHLPGESPGEESIDELRAHLAPHATIVVYTGYHRAKLEPLLWRKGAIAYVQKGDPEVLVTAVKVALEGAAELRRRQSVAVATRRLPVAALSCGPSGVPAELAVVVEEVAAASPTIPAEPLRASTGR
jgi:CheY-like chemotaxis protein